MKRSDNMPYEIVIPDKIRRIINRQEVGHAPKGEAV